MTNETPAEEDGAVGRRTLLQALAAAGAFGAAATGTTAAQDDQDDDSDADARYVVEQGEDRYEVAPLSGSEPVESFYDLRIPERYVGENGATDPGEGPYYMSAGTRDLQRPSTSLLFFYDGPDGVSLVAVHDADGDDGGSATWTVSGVPADAQWLVKDDLYRFESGEKPETNYDNWATDGPNHRIDWTWGGTRGDGGVLGHLDPGTSLGIDPAFNEEAELYGEHYEGEIDDWQLLSADGEGGVSRSTLDLDAPLTVAVEAATDGGDDTEFDLSVSPPDAKIDVESEGTVPVEIDCPDPSELDVDSVRFGAPEAVDDGDGASPSRHDGHSEDGACTIHFPVDATGIDPENALAKVAGKIDGGGESGDGNGGDSSFSLTDAIDAFDPTDDGGEGDGSDGDEDDDDGEQGDRAGRNGRGPPDHANNDEDNGRGNGNGNGRGNGGNNGNGKGKGKEKGNGRGNGKGN